MIRCEDGGKRAGQVVPDAFGQHGHCANVPGSWGQEMMFQESEAPCCCSFKRGALSFKPQELAPGADKQPINGVRFQNVGARQDRKLNLGEFVGFDGDAS